MEQFELHNSVIDGGEYDYPQLLYSTPAFLKANNHLPQKHFYFFNKNSNKYLAHLFKYILPKKYHQVVSRINIDFHRGLNCFRSTEQIIKAIILLFIGWVLVMLVYYLVSLPYLELLGLPKYSFLYFFVFTALALAIPSAPAGIGVVHYGLFLSVSILNPNIVDTNIDLVAAFVISLHFFIYLIAIISSGFIILFQNWKYNFSRIQFIP